MHFLQIRKFVLDMRNSNKNYCGTLLLWAVETMLSKCLLHATTIVARAVLYNIAVDHGDIQLEGR